MDVPTPGYDATTYGEGFADVYDEWYGDVSDIDATVEGIARLADGGPVLELGVGTGRLALPLAASGLAVTGVDASPAMLKQLRAKPGHDAIEIIEADMVDPPLPGDHYAVAFAAFNTFFNLTSRDAQLRCLMSVSAAMRSGGHVAVEGFVPPAEGLNDGGVSVRDITSTSAVITVSRHDPTQQLIVGQHIEMTAAGNVMRPWQIRYLSPPQLDALAAEAGLEFVDRWSDWRESPFTADADSHVSIYRCLQ